MSFLLFRWLLHRISYYSILKKRCQEVFQIFFVFLLSLGCPPDIYYYIQNDRVCILVNLTKLWENLWWL